MDKIYHNFKSAYYDPEERVYAYTHKANVWGLPVLIVVPNPYFVSFSVNEKNMAIFEEWLSQGFNYSLTADAVVEALRRTWSLTELKNYERTYEADVYLSSGLTVDSQTLAFDFDYLKNFSLIITKENIVEYIRNDQFTPQFFSTMDSKMVGLRCSLKKIFLKEVKL